MDAINVQRGEPLQLLIEIFEQDENGARSNLTGGSLDFYSNDLPFTPSIQITDAPNGTAMVSSTVDQIKGLRRGNTFGFQLRATFASGNPRVFPVIALLIV